MKKFIDTEFTTKVEDGEESRVPDLGGLEEDQDVRYSVMDRGDGTCLVRVTTYEDKMQKILEDKVTELVDEEAREEIEKQHPNSGLENLDQPDIEVDEEINKFGADEVLDTEEKLMARIVHNWSGLSRDQKQNVRRNYDYTDVRDLIHDMGEEELREFIEKYEIGEIPEHLDTSTLARSVVQKPTVGRQVLQDQEMTCMSKLARCKGLNRCDELTKNTQCDNEGELGRETKMCLKGCNENHEKMRRYVVKEEDSEVPWENDSNPPAKGSA